MYYFILKALPLLDCSDHWHIDIDHLNVSKKATGSKLLNLYQAPAQQLKRFEEPADIVAHPCGEYILNELQSGVPAEQVRKVLFEEYLIETTALKLQAYRRIVEQGDKYWTVEMLELREWDFLYEQAQKSKNPRRPERLQDIRSRLCAQMEVSEELIPLHTLRAFYRKHHSTASMPVQYPDSTVVKETLPLRVVQAYCRELRGRTLPALGSRCAAMFGGIIGAQVIGQ